MKTRFLQLVFTCIAFLAINTSAAVLYVDVNSASPTPPYSDWATAATNIQDAVDAASSGDQILVTNGVYQTGGRLVPIGTVTNRVAVTKAVTVQSVNGPSFTVIRGYQLPRTTNGANAVRCVYLADGATLSGFTLTNGATGGSYDYGGGLWCESANAVVSNCVLTANCAVYCGGGAFRGTLNQCTLTGNLAFDSGGAAYQSTLINCVVTGNSALASPGSGGGGGAYSCTLSNCTLSDNSTPSFGGGAYQSTLVNCTLSGNTAYRGGGAEGCGLSNSSLSNNVADCCGGGAIYSQLTNCLLDGNSASYWGGGAINCTLNDCVLTGNSAQSGGGANACTLNDCTLTINSASDGGGAYASTLQNCLLAGNLADNSGGGATGSSLTNCTLTANSATSGGGADSSTLVNCIVYYNSAVNGANTDDSSTLNYCCTTPDPGGTGNITSEPVFVNPASGDFHLGTNSPCVNTGNNASVTTGTDLDGNPRIVGDAVDIGAYELQALVSLSALIQADATNAVAGFPLYFTGSTLGGRATTGQWDFGDGTVVSNQFSSSHAWASAGDYPVVFMAFNDSNPGGVSATAMVHVLTGSIHYVSLAGTNPVAPYLSWDTAATNIQDAVDAAYIGGTVLVSNGVYSVGGRVVNGSPTNRVAVTRPLNVQSVNGPLVTVIQGYQIPGNINGDSAIRCIYLSSNAVLAGFTLTNGATMNDQFESFDFHLYFGGGVCCESGASVSNCVITSCSASDMGGGSYGSGGYSGISTNVGVSDCVIAGCNAPFGGGACGGILNDCTISNNLSGYGGGAESCVLSNCTLSANAAIAGGYGSGGGVDVCTLMDCVLSGNSSDNSGGGAYQSTLTNCIFLVNTAPYGGGTAGCTLNHCTMTGNSASQNGGGIENSTADNCTLSGNSALNGGGTDGSMLNNCVLAGNSSINVGGGAENSTLNNCNLVGNSAAGFGGGADNCTLNNCIVFYNAAPSRANYSGSTLNYCCTTPLPDSGINNITAEPQLTDAAHISANSPCIGAGSTNYSTGVDIDGEPWANPPSIGCDEYYAGAATGSLSVAIQAGFTNFAAGLAVNFTGLIIGHANMDVWDFGDGTVVTNQLSLSHSWSSAGTYPVVLTAYNDSNPAGVSTTVIVWVATQPVTYVSVNNLNPVAPYLTWDTAATNIQDAVDAAVAGGMIWVTNGIYNTGGRVVFGLLTNRVALTKPITVRSVNGALVTTIEGVPTIGDSAVRCVYLTDDATLIGFTLTNGATRSDGDWTREMSGGGAFCESTSAVLSNCIVKASAATIAGGGVYQGTLEGCVLSSNAVTYFGNGAGGGADSAVLIDCMLSNNVSYSGGGAENSTLINCTLTGNFTFVDSDYTANGGGVSGCTLTNCVISCNSSETGAGASGSTLVNCAVSGNSALGGLSGNGGGANGSTLINCTVIYNSATDNGGGVSSCVLTNCIVYFNTAPSGTNYSDDSILSYCDTMPLPAVGANNITSNPLLADLKHISSTSPCRGAGSSAAATGVDIDGDAWLNPPSIGCDEFYSNSATGALAVAISETFTNVATGFIVDFAGQISGHATANHWDFGDGTIVSNELFMSHSWATAGNYTVTFTAFNTDNPVGVTASATIFVLQNPVHYVSLNNANPLAPYFSWATAATNVQDAVDAAFAGGTIFVSNGVYQTGMRVLYGTMTNRVAVTKPLTLQSVNGAVATVIDGGFVMRCLYLTNGVLVTGFTLQNGTEVNGAGVYCQSADDVLNDCVLTNNSSPADWSSGGGAYDGILNRCVLVGNSASYLGGAAVYATLNFCVVSNNARPAYGGAACLSTLNNCFVSSNAAAWGGGVVNCGVNGCLLIGNVANYGGGGAIWSTLNNCTVVNNMVPSGPGTYGGAGVFDGTLNNCIVYYNNGNNCGADWSGISLNHCCTTPDPGGFGNITREPLFMDWPSSDFHLQTNSPCINSGKNAFVTLTNDLDGNLRIVGGTVDIGAYEYQTPTSVISYAWLQQYGLPTDGSADYTDPDGDGMNNWQEWIAGTDPTDPTSRLQMLTAGGDPSGVTVTWQSVAGITYFLQCSTNLASQPAFFTIQSDIAGQAGTTSYTDTTATNGGPYFYRVGVQQ